VSRIAILGIASEIKHLEGRLGNPIREETPAGTFSRGQWGQHEVILAQCAIGKINATMALQRLCDHYAPDVMLNCGSSGAIAPQLNVGDVVIADRIVPYDAGVFLERGFVITGNELPNRGHAHWRVFFAESQLVLLALQAAVSAGLTLAPAGRLRKQNPGDTPHDVADLRGAKAWVGPIASGDQVVFGDRPKRWLRETCDALAVENEGAAVAQVATAHGLPWLVLRGISDTADALSAFDYTPFLRYADEGNGLIPWLRLQVRRLAALLRDRRTRANWRRFNTAVGTVNVNIALLLEHLLPAL
jgi:adenosylhomocysteine nucleosidase